MNGSDWVITIFILCFLIALNYLVAQPEVRAMLDGLIQSWRSP